MIIGDLNIHVRSYVTGVTDNHDKITFGGEIVRGLISSGDFFCMNNTRKAVGGPFTRTGNMSCLDLVLASKKLEHFVEKVEIYREMKYAPLRPGRI